MTESLPLIEFTEQSPITIGVVINTTILDGTNVNGFGNEAIAFAEKHPALQLLLSFENVRYMSSAALTELLRLNETLRKTEGTVRLCNLNRDIENVFKITNLDKLFVIHTDDTTESAASRFIRALEIAQEENAWSTPDASA